MTPTKSDPPRKTPEPLPGRPDPDVLPPVEEPAPPEPPPPQMGSRELLQNRFWTAFATDPCLR